jgi:hypothetical protein
LLIIVILKLQIVEISPVLNVLVKGFDTPTVQRRNLVTADDGFATE